jgi:hypothetical protein
MSVAIATARRRADLGMGPFSGNDQFSKRAGYLAATVLLK